MLALTLFHSLTQGDARPSLFHPSFHCNIDHLASCRHASGLTHGCNNTSYLCNPAISRQGKALTACFVLVPGRRDACGVTLRMALSMSLLRIANYRVDGGGISRGWCGIAS